MASPGAEGACCVCEDSGFLTARKILAADMLTPTPAVRPTYCLLECFYPIKQKNRLGHVWGTIRRVSGDAGKSKVAYLAVVTALVVKFPYFPSFASNSFTTVPAHTDITKAVPFNFLTFWVVSISKAKCNRYGHGNCPSGVLRKLTRLIKDACKVRI